MKRLQHDECGESSFAWWATASQIGDLQIDRCGEISAIADQTVGIDNTRAYYCRVCDRDIDRSELEPVDPRSEDDE